MDHSFHRSFSPQLEDDWTYDDEQYAHSDDHLVRDDYDDHNDYEEYQEEYEVTHSDHVQSPPDGGDDPWKGVWGEDREQGSRHDNLVCIPALVVTHELPQAGEYHTGMEGAVGGGDTTILQRIRNSTPGKLLALDGNQLASRMERAGCTCRACRYACITTPKQLCATCLFNKIHDGILACPLTAECQGVRNRGASVQYVLRW